MGLAHTSILRFRLLMLHRKKTVVLVGLFTVLLVLMQINSIPPHTNRTRRSAQGHLLDTGHSGHVNHSEVEPLVWEPERDFGEEHGVGVREKPVWDVGSRMMDSSPTKPQVNMGEDTFSDSSSSMHPKDKKKDSVNLLELLKSQSRNEDAKETTPNAHDDTMEVMLNAYPFDLGNKPGPGDNGAMNNDIFTKNSPVDDSEKSAGSRLQEKPEQQTGNQVILNPPAAREITGTDWLQSELGGDPNVAESEPHLQSQPAESGEMAQNKHSPLTTREDTTDTKESKHSKSSALGSTLLSGEVKQAPNAKVELDKLVKNFNPDKNFESGAVDAEPLEPSSPKEVKINPVKQESDSWRSNHDDEIIQEQDVLSAVNPMESEEEAADFHPSEPDAVNLSPAEIEEREESDFVNSMADSADTKEMKLTNFEAKMADLKLDGEDSVPVGSMGAVVVKPAAVAVKPAAVVVKLGVAVKSAGADTGETARDKNLTPLVATNFEAGQSASIHPLDSVELDGNVGVQANEQNLDQTNLRQHEAMKDSQIDGITLNQADANESEVENFSPAKQTESDLKLEVVDTIDSEVDLAPADTFGSEVDLAPADTFGSEVALAPVDTFGSERDLAPADTFGSELALAPDYTFGSEVDLAPVDTFGSEVDLAPADTFGSEVDLAPADTFGSEVDLAPAETFGSQIGLIPVDTSLSNGPSNDRAQSDTMKWATFDAIDSGEVKLPPGNKVESEILTQTSFDTENSDKVKLNSMDENLSAVETFAPGDRVQAKVRELITGNTAETEMEVDTVDTKESLVVKTETVDSAPDDPFDSQLVNLDPDGSLKPQTVRLVTVDSLKPETGNLAPVDTLYPKTENLAAVDNVKDETLNFAPVNIDMSGQEKLAIMENDSEHLHLYPTAVKNQLESNEFEEVKAGSFSVSDEESSEPGQGRSPAVWTGHTESEAVTDDLQSNGENLSLEVSGAALDSSVGNAEGNVDMDTKFIAMQSDRSSTGSETRPLNTAAGQLSFESHNVVDVDEHHRVAMETRITGEHFDLSQGALESRSHNVMSPGNKDLQSPGNQGPPSSDFRDLESHASFGELPSGDNIVLQSPGNKGSPSQNGDLQSLSNGGPPSQGNGDLQSLGNRGPPSQGNIVLQSPDNKGSPSQNGDLQSISNGGPPSQGNGDLQSLGNRGPPSHQIGDLQSLGNGGPPSQGHGDLPAVEEKVLLSPDSRRPPPSADDAASSLQSVDGESVDVPGDACTQTLPQAVILGAVKAGANALRMFLSLHPDVAMVTPDQGGSLRYFDSDYDKGVDWYHSRMPCTRPGTVVIDRCPQYFSESFVPERVLHFSRSLKMIVILKNPVARTLAEYNTVKFYNPDKLPGTFEETVLDEKGNVKENHFLLTKSLYIVHLNNWLKYFSLRQIHIVDGDVFLTHQEGELSQVENFLGIQNYLKQDMFVYNNQTGYYCTNTRSTQECLSNDHGNPTPLDSRTVRKLQQFFWPYNEELYKILGRRFSW